MTYRPELMTDDQLTVDEIAVRAGVKPDTIRHHRHRGTMPEPDGILGKTPWWHRATGEKWLAERPGMGRPPK